jgi:hypothetical protein
MTREPVSLRRTVREVECHTGRVLLVRGQPAAEMDPVVEPSGKDLAKRTPVDRRGQRRRVVRVTVRAARRLVQDAQMRGEHRDLGAWPARRREEQPEQPRRQAPLERQSGTRVHVQPVALPAHIKRGLPLVDLDVDTGPHQSLGQTQTTETPTRHRHPQTGHQAHRPGPLVSASDRR